MSTQTYILVALVALVVLVGVCYYRRGSGPKSLYHAGVTPCSDCDYPECPNDCCTTGGCSAKSTEMHRNLLLAGAFAGSPSPSCYRCSMTPGSYKDCMACTISETASPFG